MKDLSSEMLLEQADSTPSSISVNRSRFVKGYIPENGVGNANHGSFHQEATLARWPPPSSQRDYLPLATQLLTSEAADDLLMFSRYAVRTNIESMQLDHAHLNSYQFALLKAEKRAAAEQNYQDMLAHRAAFAARELSITSMLQRQALLRTSGMKGGPVPYSWQHMRPLSALHTNRGLGLSQELALSEPSYMKSAIELSSLAHTYKGFWSESSGDSSTTSPTVAPHKPQNDIPQGKSHKLKTSPQRFLSSKRIQKTNTLTVLSGATNAWVPDEIYIDTSLGPDPTEQELLKLRSRGALMESFPVKLHKMLIDVDDPTIVAFFPHGRSFKIFDSHKFVTFVMKKYFHQSRLGSFKRQLNVYGFIRISEGPEAGGYYHPHLLRGRAGLANLIRRELKQASTSSRRAHSIPNFGAMVPIRLIDISASTTKESNSILSKIDETE